MIESTSQGNLSTCEGRKVDEERPALSCVYNKDFRAELYTFKSFFMLLKTQNTASGEHLANKITTKRTRDTKSINNFWYRKIRK